MRLMWAESLLKQEGLPCAYNTSPPVQNAELANRGDRLQTEVHTVSIKAKFLKFTLLSGHGEFATVNRCVSTDSRSDPQLTMQPSYLHNISSKHDC